MNHFELVVDGEKATSTGNTLNAIVGGVLFGVAGAVVGATSGKTVNTINSMYINVYTKQGRCERITFISYTIDKSTQIIQTKKRNAEETMALLYAIKSDN